MKNSINIDIRLTNYKLTLIQLVFLKEDTMIPKKLSNIYPKKMRISDKSSFKENKKSIKQEINLNKKLNTKKEKRNQETNTKANQDNYQF